jgi:hypothetical protein
VIAFIRGDTDSSPQDYVVGSFNFYDHRAASRDLLQPNRVPTNLWVWGEGLTADVPAWLGRKVLLVGPPSYERTWSLARDFPALQSHVEMQRELPRDEVISLLARLSENLDTGP